jgi:hypothetical protein
MSWHTQVVLAALILSIGSAACSDELLDVPEDPSPPVSPPPHSEPVPPVAAAGNDIRIADMNEDGAEQVLLDGCASMPGSHPILSFEWRDGQAYLGGDAVDGACSIAVELALGLHVITLTVTDAAGQSARDEVKVDIREPRPHVRIESPLNGSTHATGSQLTFRAVARDWSGQPLTREQVAWSSSVDGPMGIGAAILRGDLSKGDHVISVTATDPEGRTGVAEARIRLADPPTVTIISPADGSSFAVLDDVFYEGRCIDSQGSEVTGQGFIWTPRPCMADPHEPRCGVSYYVPGSDTTVLRCTDADGLTAEASVTIGIYVSYARNIEPYPHGFGCTECHGTARQEGGVRLDSYQALTTGGNANGPLIVPGESGQGILIPKLLTHHHDPSREALINDIPWVWMPLEMIEHWWTTELLADWIAHGAPDN